MLLSVFVGSGSQMVFMALLALGEPGLASIGMLYCDHNPVLPGISNSPAINAGCQALSQRTNSDNSTCKDGM